IMDAALVQSTSVRDEALGILSRLGVPQSAFGREGVLASSPITGELIAYVRITSPEGGSAVIGRATEAFDAWRKVPPPQRGEFVRLLAFDKPIKLRWSYVEGKSIERQFTTAIFRQKDKDKPNVHHDVLEMPDGQQILLTALSEGQNATVLQLPAAPKSDKEAEEQKRAEYVG